MIAIIDYGRGNLFSLKNALDFIGADTVITSDKDVIASADKLILPGVGAFPDAMNRLNELNLTEFIKEQAKIKPLLGICLGMQLLFERSFEFGCFDGLSLIPGDIVSFEGKINKDLKIPEIGWNELRMNKQDSVLYKGFSGREFVYFVHSYFADCDSKYVSAFSEYDIDFPASVEYENVFGCQFHPEKSGKAGLKILDNFCKAGFSL